MKIDDIYNSIDKVKMSKEDEEELLNKITDSKTKKTSNKFSYKNKIRIPVAACLTILIVTFSCSSTVRASVHDLGRLLFDSWSSEDNFDTQNIEDYGLKEPLVMTKNGITVTVNQCIFSNSEMFLDYTVNAPNARYKMRNDILNTSFELYDGDKDVTEKLFKKWLGGTYNDSSSDINTEKKGDENTSERIYIKNGENLKYKGKTLKMRILVVEGAKFTDFKFDIKIDKLYPEKSKKINEKVIYDNGKEITISEVKNTFSKVLITGIGPIDDPGQVRIKDKSGEKLRWDGGDVGGENVPFEAEFYRKSLNNTDEYTIEVYDTNNKLIKEIPVKLENIHK